MARTLANTIGKGLAPGSTHLFSGSEVPEDYLEANGQTFDKNAEPDLFNAIGNLFNPYDVEASVQPIAMDNAYAGYKGGVAISGDGTTVAVTVRPLGDDYVTVYDFDGTTFTNPKTIASPSFADLGGFPTVSLSDDGTVLAVGYESETVGGYSEAGVVKIYKLIASVWTLDATLEPSAPADGRFMGISTSISGNGLKVVLSPEGRRTFDIWKDDGGGTWNIEQTITWVDDYSNGAKLNQNGTVVLLGSRSNEGEIYVYKFSGTWILSQQLKVLLVGIGGTDGVGGPNIFDISNDGLSVIVGAQGFNRAWYLTSDGNTFSLTEQLTSPIGSDGFGRATRISGDGKTIAISVADTVETGYQDGGIIIYHLGVDGFKAVKVIYKVTGTAGGRFGISIDIDNDGSNLCAGASSDDTGGTNRGRLYGIGGLPRVNALVPPNDGTVYITKK